jgi:signal transduction histidine kinase
MALALAAAAALPLAYGLLSTASSGRSARESAVAASTSLAHQTADEIHRDLASRAVALKALGNALQGGVGLDIRQREAMLRAGVLDFEGFHSLTMLDGSGQVLAASEPGHPGVSAVPGAAPAVEGVTISDLRLGDDGVPEAAFAVRLEQQSQPAGWLVGTVRLAQVTRLVSYARAGERGCVRIVAPDGTLLAQGDSCARFAEDRIMARHPLLERGTDSSPATAQEYVDEAGEVQLGVAAGIDPLGWTVIVEQPVEEVYAFVETLRRELTAATALALVGAGSFLFAGRRFIETTPLTPLAVPVESDDPRSHERDAMFGRVCAGLVHDLAHPIQNIANTTRLLLRDDTDSESRASLQRTLERELGTLKRFMDDLRQVVLKPRPVERFATEVNASVAEVVDAMRAESERAGVKMTAQCAGEPLVIAADRFALGRVYRNLLSNAIQATGPGGRVSISTARAGDRVQVTVADTGAGIPPDRLSAVFDDFVTTRRGGLGLGLAVSKRIVQELEGTITVESEVGRGTSFVLCFPRCSERARAAS